MVQADSRVLKLHTDPMCPRLGEEKEHGMCERRSVPLPPEETYQCVEIPPLQCPQHEFWVQEGSVCFLFYRHQLAYNCTSGKWTRTDAVEANEHRQKRFPWIPVAIGVTFVACLFLCPRGSGGSTPSNQQPEITCPKDVTRTAPAGHSEVKVSWTVPSATDPDGGEPDVTRIHGPDSGSLFSEGRTHITYEAKDEGGLTKTCLFLVHVKVVRCSYARRPRNGQRPLCSGAPEENQFGSQCDFSCHKGYILTGSRTLTCQKDKRWSHPFPTCSPVSCGDPGAVAGGSVECHNGHSYPAWCSIMCSKGFRNTGAQFTSCSADAVWTPINQCEDVEAPTFPSGCPPDIHQFSGPLGSPVSVTWNDPDVSDNSGDNITLTSDTASGSSFLPGFHTVRVTATDTNGNSRICKFFVIIQERRCASPSITNGHVTCDNGNLEGSKCMASCTRGYQVQGSATVTCLDTRTWSPALPTCQVVTCPPTLPVVAAGSLTCPTGHQYQASCVLTCSQGYTAQQPLLITCGPDGKWSTPGSCKDTQAPTLDCPDNVEEFASRLGQDTTVTWASPTVTDNSGETVDITSDVVPGSPFVAGVTYVTYTATDTSGNTGTCRFSVTVTTLSCGEPDLEDPARAHTLMVYQCPDGYMHGAQCVVSCTQGYPLRGSSTITCERDDALYPPQMSWESSGTRPECIENKCPKLGKPKNGALTCLLGNYGWDCIMSCNDNWDIQIAFDGHYLCTNSKGYWEPSTVRDCIVAYRPNRAKLPSEFYYFTGSCSMSTREIKDNFIAALQNSKYQDACVNVPTCTVDNIQVTCGPTARRRRSAEDGGDEGVLEGSERGQHRQRRATSGSHELIVTFDIVLDYVQNGTAEETLTLYKTLENATWTFLKKDAEAGVFDMGSLTPDIRYILYPTLTFDGCPNGTKFHQRVTNTKASCVGCSRGHYLADEECEECPLGHFTELDNATSCTACPPGFSTLATASGSSDDCQELCTAGSFSPTGFVPCQPCPAGQYLSHDQGVTCDLCPAGTWTEFAGAQTRNDCVAADIKLFPNTSLTMSLTSEESSITAVTWMKLAPNTSLSLTFELSVLPASPLTLLVFCNGSSDIEEDLTQVEATSVQVPAEQWTQLVMVSQTGSGSVTLSLYHDSQWLLDIPLPPFPTPFTAHFTASGLRGLALLSGEHAERRAWGEEELQALNSSCTPHLEDNVFTWLPRPSAILMPSTCDAVDECQSSPCGLHGVCENQRAGFLCHCLNGWSDHTCQVPPDACYQHQCQNGALCVPAGLNYTCDCLEDNAGQFCQLDKVHGGWGEWEDWSPCSHTCQGQQHRQRPCTNPAPSNGGNNCSGPATETQHCGEAVCSVDGEWSEWSDWTSCSATCGGGETTRVRQCDSPAPQNGAPCSGLYSETDVCSSSECPVDGGWGLWSKWTPCSVTCGEGTQSRERSCDSPVPANEGQPCQGSSNQTQLCNVLVCPECSVLPEVDGTHFNCSETADPYRLTCRVTCAQGYSSVIHPEYMCGQETEYLWNFQRQGVKEVKHAIQYCRPIKTPSVASTSTSVTLPGAPCDRTDQVKDQIHHNLNGLLCVRHNKCQISTWERCHTPSSGSSRRKRSADTIMVMVNLTADFGPSFSAAESDRATVEEFVRVFSMVDQSAAMIALNDTESLFTVTVDDVIITPDVNATSYTVDLGCSTGASLSPDGACVDCAPGFYEEGGHCWVCPKGQYQDQPASTSCKPCPPGKTWDTTGASDLSQCLYPTEAPPSEPEGRTTGIILAASIGGFLALVLIVTIIIVVCLRRRQQAPAIPANSKVFENQAEEAV
ncbi:uncharacterized protein LOC143301165 [Babylonia areolata]|uniref:uncharacterized protein LOC143301165 n=1 Tax=Babylonia areolata TaxID=304850 RepID=UPI003FD38AF9